MLRIVLIAATAALFAGCNTFALTGTVEYQRKDDEGRQRSEMITGLLAVPTPRHNTLVLIPLHKSYTYQDRSGSNLPLSVQQWASQQWASQQLSPAPAPPDEAIVP